MRNIKLFTLTLAVILSTVVSAETLYVLSGKCNVPLVAGMSNSKYQLFTWDGTTATVTTDITCNLTSNTGGSYYESTSLALSDLKNLSNYNASSSQKRTMQAFKLAGSNTLTVNLGSKTMSKVIVVGRANSTDNLSIGILGETKTTNNKDFFVIEKEQSFTGTISIENTTSKEYNFFIYMVEGQPAPTVSVTGVTVSPADLEIEVGATSTLTANVSPTDASNKKVTWSSDNNAIASVNETTGVVTGVSGGNAKITATTADGGFTADCNVTVTVPAPIPVTAISIAPTATVGVGSTTTLTVTYEPANANTGKALEWESDNSNIASVNNNGVVTGVAAGTTTITATSTTDASITASCTVTVEEKAIPYTTLSLHQAGIYEAKEKEGGYDGTLSEFNNREYEVYYASFLESGALSVTTTPTQKSEGITTSISDYNCKAKDGWFELKTSTSKSNYTMTATDEFKAGDAAVHKLLNNAYYKMHIKGFDQFSFYGKDNSTTISSETGKNKRFQVFIDDELQEPENPSTSASIRRYDISTGEHVIEVRGIGASNNEFYGFSLRVAQEPKTKYVKGNDTTQTVLATTAPNPVYYYTKYNSKGETRLLWDGEEATGITLQTKGSSVMGDTLVLGGVANCPAGTYKYRVASFFNNIETSSVSGTFTVYNQIKAMTDTVIDAYVGEEMDPIKLRFYNSNPNGWVYDEHGSWPDGINHSNKDGIITFSGTPTTAGDYLITVSVFDGNSVNCRIKVIAIDYGVDPILYLYKNTAAYEKDAAYAYLKNTAGKNLIPRKTKEALRDIDPRYKWILISEDVDADNPEVLAIARGETNLPVLNMKGFSYSPDRLDWGEPDNGTLDTVTDNRYNIFVQRADHPIFQSLGWTQGEKVKILTQVGHKGLMPVDIDYPGSVCLATAYTRNIKDYYKDGELQTVLHEIPASLRNGHKYICLPIAADDNALLSAKGQQLLNAVVDYLLNNAQTVSLPDLEITDFAVDGVKGDIDDLNSTIYMELDMQAHANLNIKALKPVVSVADQTLTHVVPTADKVVDFSESLNVPVIYTVTDYINRREYEVRIKAINAQGLDDVYAVGEWVNIYDIYGRLVTTTNENIYTMALPRGMYMAVTAGGQTIKLMK